MRSRPAKALVVGCGVIGLSAALRLQQAGIDVSIKTAALPLDTTSSLAAALWLPYKAYPEDRVLGWGGHSLGVFGELVQGSNSGVRMREGMMLSREPQERPWWESAVPAIRPCTEDELPDSYRSGYLFTVPVIETRIYLEYLLKRFTAYGGRVELHRISSLEEAGEGADVVVNCAGLGAKELAGDRSMSPIRGQIVRVSNPGLERFVVDEDDPERPTYIVPRSSDCVLGGTAEEGRWDTEPDMETAQEILARCTDLEPRLSRAQILEHKVGLRPGRPEVRLELEELPGGTPCVHNYGHGGAGVTLSWGCAEETLALVEQALEA